MITATIARTKNELSRFLGMVKSGETVLILDRNHPVARLCPVGPPTGSTGDDAKLLKLEANGLIRRPPGNPDWRSLLADPPPALRAGASALGALLDERETSR